MSKWETAPIRSGKACVEGCSHESTHHVGFLPPPSLLQFLLSGFPLRGGGDDYNPTPSSRDEATALYATTSRFAQSAVREEEEQQEDGGEKEPRPPGELF